MPKKKAALTIEQKIEQLLESKRSIEIKIEELKAELSHIEKSLKAANDEKDLKDVQVLKDAAKAKNMSLDDLLSLIEKSEAKDAEKEDEEVNTSF